MVFAESDAIVMLSQPEEHFYKYQLWRSVDDYCLYALKSIGLAELQCHPMLSSKQCGEEWNKSQFLGGRG